MSSTDSASALQQDTLSIIMLPLFLLAILLEAGWSWRAKKAWYQPLDTLASLSMLLSSAVVEILPRTAAVVAMVYLHDSSPLRDLVGRQWWAWLLLFLLDDFSYYWFHRLNHEVRLFWAGHVNHH